jgi:hypothetical protein
MKIRTALTICAIAVVTAVVAPVAGAKGVEAAQTDAVTTESLVLGIWDGLAFRPEIEAIATDDGVEQKICDYYAGSIGDQIQDAIDAADADDVEAMEANLQEAERLESLAGDLGCAIVFV